MTSVVTPQPVYCVVEGAYRDRSVAERVCQGRFLHQGIAVDLGVEPDWLGSALPPDPEWRLEWMKFYYGLNLASAFRETGEKRFLNTWECLVRSWIRQVPVTFDPCDVIGRRIQNWIYAWSSFARSDAFEGLGDGLPDTLLLSLGAQVEHLHSNLTRERNHRTLELYALFIAALGLPILDPGGHLLAFAMEALQQNLQEDIGVDGVQRERSTHYHHVVLRSFLGARENARRFGLRFSSEFDDRLIRACEFSMHLHRPDGTIPALSDSDSGSYLDLLALAADLFGRTDFLYVATRGKRGNAPLATNPSFPIGGYYIQRSRPNSRLSSTDTERFLVFDCSPLGDGGHGHYDALNFEIADGRPLVVDPGRYTYCDDPPHWRRWFKCTAAHNTVSVDGLDQTPYRRGKPKGPVARACLLQRLTAPDLDVLYGEVTSPAYEAVHRRRILFVARNYWIVHDSLEGSGRHRYDLRFHFAPAATALTQIDRHQVRVPGLGLIVAPPWPIVIEDGWVSATYGVKESAPVIIATADHAECAEFLSLLMPLADDAPMPAFTVTRHMEGRETILIAEVMTETALGRRRDSVMWTASGRAAALPSAGAAEAAVILDADADGRSQTVVPRFVDVYAGFTDSGVASSGVAV
jgi:Heparinase II/III-like protein/Heparinase II/III N-terminus